MAGSKWMIAGITATAILAFAWSVDWFVEQLNPEEHPGRLAYAPVDDLPASVDLAAVQRGWPGSLDEPGMRYRLRAYLRDTEGAAPAAAATPGAAATPEAPIDLGTLLASADAGAGEAKARACTSCHDFTSGGADRLGPNLFGVVGRDIAARTGFAYSSAMTAEQGAWTYDRLFAYLASPARSVPGTKMSFSGMRRPEDRAAVIKYLATLGGSAPPPPPPLAAAGGIAAK